jgi:hypothetical protein
MTKEKEIRPKGDRKIQSIYFLNYEMFKNQSIYGDSSPQVLNNLKGIALRQRAKGLILQNPKPVDLPKYKIH